MRNNRQEEIFLPVKYNGRECSVLSVLQEMLEESRWRRNPKKIARRKNGKHAGSVLRKEKEEFALSDLDLPAFARTGELRLKRFCKKKDAAILFVVDASRSQGAGARLSFSKGAMMAVLESPSLGRNRTGMILFGRSKAERILPFTRSIELAAGKTEGLKAGGNTPLAMGLRMALKEIEKDSRKYPGTVHMIFLMTDGKANYDIREGNPVELALEAAEKIKAKGIPVLVADTENTVFAMGIAEKIAGAAGGRYVKLTE